MRHSSAIAVSLVLFSSILLASPKKKTLGRVEDASRLLSVHSFCLQPSGVTLSQQTDVDKFVVRGSPPKGVLARMGWQALSDCSKADAEVHLTLNAQDEPVAAVDSANLGNAASAMTTETVSRAKIVVTVRLSGKELYEVEGEAVHSNRQGAVASPFAKLSKDLQNLSK